MAYFLGRDVELAITTEHNNLGINTQMFHLLYRFHSIRLLEPFRHILHRGILPSLSPYYIYNVTCSGSFVKGLSYLFYCSPTFSNRARLT